MTTRDEVDRQWRELNGLPADQVAHMGAEKRAALLRRELDAERDAHAETRREWEQTSRGLLATMEDLDREEREYAALREEHAGTVEANEDLQVERERVARYVAWVIGTGTGYERLERLRAQAEQGADALAAAAADWEER